jgi:hypothetical protein
MFVPVFVSFLDAQLQVCRMVGFENCWFKPAGYMHRPVCISHTTKSAVLIMLPTDFKSSQNVEIFDGETLNIEK